MFNKITSLGGDLLDKGTSLVDSVSTVPDNITIVLEAIKGNPNTRKDINTIILLMLIKEEAPITDSFNELLIEFKGEGYIDEKNNLTESGDAFYLMEIGYFSEDKIAELFNSIKEIVTKKDLALEDSKSLYKIGNDMVIIVLFTLLKDHPIWTVAEIIESLFIGDSKNTKQSKSLILDIFSKLFI